jgi:hypothetical protein
MIRSSAPLVCEIYASHDSVRDVRDVRHCKGLLVQHERKISLLKLKKVLLALGIILVPVLSVTLSLGSASMKSFGLERDGELDAGSDLKQ